VTQDVFLESYALGTSGLFLGNPDFTIKEGVTNLSANNTSNSSGDTHAFNGGTIPLSAGTTYTFEVETSGAAVQAFLGSWQYSQVPEPSTFTLVFAGLAGWFLRRRSQ